MLGSIADGDGSTTTLERPTPQPQVEQLPPWKVILHDDKINEAEFVVNKVQEITKLEEKIAVQRVLEAHKNGIALLLTTHREKAELFVEMFETYQITVTMEKV